MIVIGFTGKKESGKTAATHALKSKLEPFNFKDPLINEVRANFPDLLRQMQIEYSVGNALLEINTLFELKPPLIRKLLQNYGTDVRRNDDENYWVNRWMDRLADYNGNAMADDVRFLNEAEAVKKLGGIVIRIVRPGLETTDTHISEMEMEKIEADYEIINDGSLKDLSDKVNGIYQIFKNS